MVAAVTSLVGMVRFFSQFMLALCVHTFGFKPKHYSLGCIFHIVAGIHRCVASVGAHTGHLRIP